MGILRHHRRQLVSITRASMDARLNDPYWLQEIKHQGRSAYNRDPAYRVFRNVREFGAVGDGVTDDTAAIKRVSSD